MCGDRDHREGEEIIPLGKKKKENWEEQKEKKP